MLKRVICFGVLCALSFSGLATDLAAAAKTNVRLGLTYLQKGMYPQSKARLLSAIKQDPQIAASWYGMAYYQEKTGDIKTAEKYYLKAISVEPTSGAAQNNYGTFLCRTGRYKAAISQFVDAAHQRSYLDAASAYENAGTCALMIPNKKMAMFYFKHALKNNPNLPFSLLSVARLNHEAGNDVEANKYFMLFENIAMKNKSAAEVKKYHDYVFS
jgi:type IV pilus assembly protein PilF